jgi:hypothetical protein
MIAALENKRDEIAEVCRQFGVCRLEVFGSASEGDFDPERSDVDFLVEFCPGVSMGPWLARYFDLNDALASLLGCPVDLVMLSSPALEKPYFAREANRTRRPIYVAEVA